MKFRVVATSRQLTDDYEVELGWRVFCGASAIAAAMYGECLDIDTDEELKSRCVLPNEPLYDNMLKLWGDVENIFVVEIDTETGEHEILHC